MYTQPIIVDHDDASFLTTARTDSIFFLKFSSSCFSISPSFSSSSRISLLTWLTLSVLAVHSAISTYLVSLADILLMIPVKLFRHFNWFRLLYTASIYYFVLMSIWLGAWTGSSSLGSPSKIYTRFSSLLSSMYLIFSSLTMSDCSFYVFSSEMILICLGGWSWFTSLLWVVTLLRGSSPSLWISAIYLSSFSIYSLYSSLIGCLNNYSNWFLYAIRP